MIYLTVRKRRKMKKKEKDLQEILISD